LLLHSSPSESGSLDSSDEASESATEISDYNSTDEEPLSDLNKSAPSESNEAKRSQRFEILLKQIETLAKFMSAKLENIAM
jgi:hypothetical protein